MRRVIVCGSRTWRDRERIAVRIARLLAEGSFSFPDPTIVHGAARGADLIAGEEAIKAGLLVETHPAAWEDLGKAAGYLRNEKMAKLEGVELVIAFWDGKSNGTRHMIGVAEREGIPVDVVRP